MRRMNHLPTRRSLLKTSALAAGTVAFSPFLSFAQSPTTPRKKLLFFTKSAGFQHSVITRPADNPSKLSYAEQILTDFGAKHGFDVTCSKDGTTFTPDNIASFDAFVFYTTGVLTNPSPKYATKRGPDGKPTPDTTKLIHDEPAMTAEGKQAFLDAIQAGKGFVGFHSTTDTFHAPKHVKGEMLRNVDAHGNDEFDPFIKMLGGEFIVHGKQQPSTLRAIDPDFPGAKPFDNATIHEEWYSLKNFAHDLHVILAHDTTAMTGPMYERPAYPQTWARTHGAGRVFYTSLGHREDIWQRPDFLALTLAALNWTTRRLDADVTPNLHQATPNADLKRP
jgi:type 1 glutamine amidotransferase